MKFTNEFEHMWNQLTGKHNGAAPEYPSFGDAIQNKNPHYSSPNGYVSTSALRVPAQSGSSLAKAIESGVEKAGDAIKDLVSKTKDTSAETALVSSRSSSGSSAPLVYIDAPYAEKYGMDSSTAYQEALANTSHQREVADLKAAGLNPVLSANGGSGASVFSGSVYSPGEGSSGYSSSSKSAISATDVGNIVGGVVGLISPRLGSSAAKLAKGVVSLASSVSSSR